MNASYRPERASNFFILAGIGIIVFIWFALILGVSGLFFLPLIAFGFALICTLTLFLLLKTLSLLDLPEKVFILLFLVIAFMATLPVNPTVFTGRDQGAIATAAIELATRHDFRFSIPAADTFFSLYGPGVAYNFPGFFYTNSGQLLTQFPLAYTAWLGSFYSLFQLNGLLIGNGVLFSGTLITFFFLLRIFLNRLVAFFGVIFFTTSFLPLWFVKFTLTENLALFLFVFLSFALIRFAQSGTFLSYTATLSAIGLFCFTRIEGFIILPIVLIILARLRYTHTLWKHYPKKSFIAPIILFLFTFFATFPDTYPFYITIGKAVKHFVTGISGSIEQTLSPATLFLPNLFIVYGLFCVFLFGGIGIYFLIRRKIWIALIPLLLALPTGIYLFFPNITPDHPWMLRRYLPTLYPTAVFATLVGLSLVFSSSRKLPLTLPHGWRRQSLFTGILIGLFMFQISTGYRALLARENTNLLEQTQKITPLFDDRDLILIDGYATGSGFAMITGPLSSLYHKNAVYFFNPADLPKIDRSLYEHTWLIVPTTDMHQWENRHLPNITLTPTEVISFGSTAFGEPHIKLPPFSEVGPPTPNKKLPSFPETTPFFSADVVFKVE